MCVDDPAERRAQRAADHDRAWPEFVDEPAFDGHKPGFRHDEYRERGLDRRLTPMVGVVHRYNEKGPRVLKIGDESHAEDADRELHPPVMPEACAHAVRYSVSCHVSVSFIFRRAQPARWTYLIDSLGRWLCLRLINRQWSARGTALARTAARCPHNSGVGSCYIRSI